MGCLSFFPNVHFNLKKVLTERSKGDRLNVRFISDRLKMLSRL